MIDLIITFALGITTAACLRNTVHIHRLTQKLKYWEPPCYPAPDDFLESEEWSRDYEDYEDYEDCSSKQRQANMQPCWSDYVTTSKEQADG